QRGLAGAGRAHDASEGAGVDVEVDVAQGGTGAARAAVGARHAFEADQRHWGYSARSGLGASTGTAWRARASPPRLVTMVTKSAFIRPSHECPGSPGFPGRSSSRSWST